MAKKGVRKETSLIVGKDKEDQKKIIEGLEGLKEKAEEKPEVKTGRDEEDEDVYKYLELDRDTTGIDLKTNRRVIVVGLKPRIVKDVKTDETWSVTGNDRIKVDRLIKLVKITRPAPRKLINTKPIWFFLFNVILAKRIGDKWRLEPEELAQISEDCNNLLREYAPFLDQYGAIFNFTFTVLMIIGARTIPEPKGSIGEPKKLKSEKSKEK